MKTKNPLTPKAKKFMREYLVDYNVKRAAMAAGYKQPSVYGQRLLKNPIIAQQIKAAQTRDEKKLELTKEEIAKQLYFLVSRDASEFVDEDGVIKNIKEMDERARSIIDGIDQEVHINLETGEKVVKNKIRLSSKVTAVDLAMRHKGMIAATKQQMEVTAKLDLSALVGRPENPTEAIEGKILALESEEEPKS
jgi:phage terminase small subunit